jgi:tetratricopeptide (TPR) repeat protein
MRPMNAAHHGNPSMALQPMRRLCTSLHLAVSLAGAVPCLAADVDLARAEQLVREGRYEEAYELMIPFEARNRDDAEFNSLLGESALRSGRAGMALEFFGRSLEAAPESIDAHLGLGRAYLAMGNYARAKIEFEMVLRFDDLPIDIHQQVEIYARAAEDYASGVRFLSYGYAITGFGNYSVNATDGTDEFGGSDTDDNFLSLRGGGGFNYQLSGNYLLDVTLDYRFRDYDNGDRRDDKDLRWNGAINRSLGDNSLLVGLRGRNSYRGNGDYRNDYGIYGEWRHTQSPDDQLDIAFEFRRRDYPRGPLRERSRNIAELTAGWTHVIGAGAASLSLNASGGREFATDDRPDGDSNFFGLSSTLSFTLTDTLGGFMFVWWQNQRYNIERINVDAADNILGISERNDDLYELGGGLSWQFARGWSLNPEILYIRDESNILAAEYSSTEIWITVRKDF